MVPRGSFRAHHEAEQSINFVTCHDGFTLNDLVSYDHKHNEANGEQNRDGANDNLSWNCGVEGPTDDAGIEALRNRQVKEPPGDPDAGGGHADAAHGRRRPPGRRGFLACEPGAQARDEQQVEQSVEHRLLAREIALHLGHGQIHHRAQGALVGYHDDRRQGGQHALRDAAGDPVAAGEHGGRGIPGVTAGPRGQREVLGQRLPGGGGARAARVDDVPSRTRVGRSVGEPP